MKTINVTVNIENGEVAVFTIQFKNSDFLKVVNSVGNATLENIFTNPLWAVV